MKRFLLITTIICTLTANGQTYLISFSGTGASTTVNSVIVENLRTNDVLTLNGGDILQLSVTTGINDLDKDKSSRINIYPNPMRDKSTLQISSPVPGEALISISDFKGRQIIQTKENLGNYIQEFTVSGLRSGTYIINVKGNNYQFSGKLISTGESKGRTSIEKVRENGEVYKMFQDKEVKGVQATVDMEYSTGDIIKITGKSDIYSTVVTDIPTGDKTITFNFIACTDGEGNNYPVVEIGSGKKGYLGFMGENLRTTKYNDQTAITLVEDNMAWSNLTTPAYCWYNNDSVSYANIYGALYNAYTISTGKLCPEGWHVPTNAEWADLIAYLGASAGNKMKETGSIYWKTPNFATNASGFTARGGGGRLMGGYFSNMTIDAYWWSSTEMDPMENYSRTLNYYESTLFQDYGYKSNGYSVRCAITYVTPK